MKKQSNWAHQGDITFVPIKSIKGIKEKHGASITVGYGTATGHHHVLSVKSPKDMEVTKVGDVLMLDLKKEAVVTHEEHKPIKLAAGKYRIGHEKEKDWFSLTVRAVVD